ncbi:hypothetical protein BTR23_19230 [Alkalihalophilus pseudofirmus]|nr:hypothetical protein BTR23_19230 [Alkalihalophilus pseudofirmus]
MRKPIVSKVRVMSSKTFAERGIRRSVESYIALNAGPVLNKCRAVTQPTQKLCGELSHGAREQLLPSGIPSNGEDFSFSVAFFVFFLPK